MKLMIQSMTIKIERDFAIVGVEMDGGESATAVARLDEDRIDVTVNATDAALEEELAPTVQAVLTLALSHGM